MEVSHQDFADKPHQVESLIFKQTIDSEDVVLPTFRSSAGPSEHQTKLEHERVSPTSIDFNMDTSSSTSTAKTSESTYNVASSTEKRRERNSKISARRNRTKHKQELEALHEHIAALQSEIRLLKCQESSAQSVSRGLSLKFSAAVTDKVMTMLHKLIGAPSTLEAAFSHDNFINYIEQRPFYVVGVTGHSYPIIYASQAFASLTGYEMHAIIGRNCGFLHGPLTDKVEVQKLNKGITEGRDVSSKLINYHRDGSTFWTHVQLGHVIDVCGKTEMIVGVHSKISTSASARHHSTHLLDSFVSDYVVTPQGITAAHALHYVHSNRTNASAAAQSQLAAAYVSHATPSGPNNFVPLTCQVGHFSSIARTRSMGSLVDLDRCDSGASGVSSHGKTRRNMNDEDEDEDGNDDCKSVSSLSGCESECDEYGGDSHCWIGGGEMDGVESSTSHHVYTATAIATADNAALAAGYNVSPRTTTVDAKVPIHRVVTPVTPTTTTTTNSVTHGIKYQNFTCSGGAFVGSNGTGTSNRMETCQGGGYFIGDRPL